MRNLILLPLSAALALTACGGDKPAPTAAPAASAPAATPAAAPATPITGPKISGSVLVDGVSSLPSGIELSVKLQDATDPAALPTLINERVTAAPPMLPSGFEIGYDPATIDQSRRYVVEVMLRADGMILYGTPAPVPVLTQGVGDSNFSLTLVRGGKPVTTLAPPDQLKADFKKLEARLGALRRITGERMDEQVSIGWDAFVDPVSGQVLMAREQVELAEGGTTAYRFAYQGGQPQVIERKQGGAITLLGWTSDGQMILNEKGSEQASEAEIEQLKQRALALYGTAAARR